jgi:hypothetical protein
MLLPESRKLAPARGEPIVTNDKRMKLSDVEARTKYAFRGSPTTFNEAYPTVRSLILVIEAGSAIRGEREQTLRFTEKSLQPIIDCRNPRCYGGGLNVDQLLRWSVVGSGKTEFEDTKFCEGYEGSPGGRKRTGSCDTRYTIKVSVKYKPLSGEPDTT